MPQVVAQILMAMLYKLVTQEAVTDLFIWTAEHLAAKTTSSVDDELVGILKKYLTK